MTRDRQPGKRRGGARSRPAAALCAAALGTVLTACGAQQQALWTVPVNGGSQGQSGGISVQNAVFAARPPTPEGDLYRPGETVPVTATIVNRTSAPDQLVSVSSPAARGGALAGPNALPPDSAITPGAAGSGEVLLTGLTAPIRPGLTYPVVLTFAHAGRVRIDVRGASASPPRQDCPLPPNGQAPDVFTAPDGAPVPPRPPHPDCSTLP